MERGRRCDDKWPEMRTLRRKSRHHGDGVTCDKKRYGFYAIDWRGYESLKYFAKIYGINVAELVEEFVETELETLERKMRKMRVTIENNLNGNRSCTTKEKLVCSFAKADSDGDYICQKYPSILVVTNKIPERCAACVTENGVTGLAKELRAARKAEREASSAKKQGNLPIA